MAANGAPVKRVMTDNAFAYRLSRDFQDALAALGAKHVLIKPRHPWQNAKQNASTAPSKKAGPTANPSHRTRPRTEALQPWLGFYNNYRPHGSLGGKPPISRRNQPTG